jgi:hypothetical protein
VFLIGVALRVATETLGDRYPLPNRLTERDVWVNVETTPIRIVGGFL